MIKIAIVYQYPEFARHTQIIQQHFPNAQIKDFYRGRYANIEMVAKEAVHDKSDAIVCGGFTYDSLINKIDIPIIDIEPSLSDLIASWHNIEQRKLHIKRAAVFLFHRNPMLQEEGLESRLSELFGTEITFVKYKSISEYDTYIESLGTKTDIIIGGAHSIEKCKKMNIRNEFLGIGINTFRLGVAEAIRVSSVRVLELFKKNQIRAVLDSSHEGIIFSNDMCQVELINPLAKNILSIAPDKIVEGTSFNDIIPGSKIELVLKTGRAELEDILTLPSGNKIMLNMVPVNISGVVRGVVSTFKDVTRLMEMEKKIRADLHKKGTVAKYKIDDIVGNSDVMNRCRELVKQFGKYDGNILIHGETGTGKELFAQSIHNESCRKNEPFYAINCAALPDNLLESELFGYSEGSFTGAKKGGKPGIFELAHGGTVYLDEIGEMTMSCQSTLLRVLQEKEVRRIGDDKITPINVRIIAASHKNLYTECINNRFREDLYYRINVLSLSIPPLRERQEDIFILIDHFVDYYSKKYNEKIDLRFTPESHKFLMNYPWRGNIRELQNFVQRIISYGFCEEIITIQRAKSLLNSTDMDEDLSGINNNDITRKIHKTTITSINEAIRMFNGNKTKAAEYLGVSRTYIWRKLNEKT